jgi:hypothetical protein
MLRSIVRSLQVRHRTPVPRGCLNKVWRCLEVSGTAVLGIRVRHCGDIYEEWRQLRKLLEQLLKQTDRDVDNTRAAAATDGCGTSGWKKWASRTIRNSENENTELGTIKVLLACLLEREGRRKEMICPDLLQAIDAVQFSKWRIFRSKWYLHLQGLNCAGRGILTQLCRNMVMMPVEGWVTGNGR